MAAQAVVNGGMTQTKAAKVFGASRTSVCLWVKSYRKEGEEALQSKPKGRPKGGKLTSRQMESIRKSVIGKHPDQLRLPGLLWTRDLVRLLILRRLGVSLSRWTLVSRSQKKQHFFVNKNNNCWLLRCNEQPTYFKTPINKYSGKRFSCNAITAITKHGDLSFMVFEDKFTVKIFLDYLSPMLKQQAGRKAFLVVDRYSVHKAKKIEEWLNEQEGTIKLFFLPAYSPELNPDELAIQDIKSNIFRDGRAKDKPELMGKLRSFLHSRQRRPAKVQKCFEGKCVAYAKAV